jgi:hypothetical protein
MFDRDTLPSLTYQVRKFQHISTDANGQCTVLVTPRVTDMGRTAATYTGSTVATWNAYFDAPNATDLTTEFSRYRVVSAGVRVFSIVAPLSASGSVVVQVSRNAAESPDITSYAYEEVYHTPLKGADLVWVTKPAEEFDHYRDITYGGAYIHSSVAYISVYGGPATTPVIGLEWILNLELIPKADTYAAQLTTDAAPHVPPIEAASATMLGNMESVFYKGVSQLSSAVTRMATDYVRSRASAFIRDEL